MKPDSHRRSTLGVVALLAALAAALPAQAQEATFADFPSVIYCEFEGYQRAYYFSQLGPEGRAVYMSPDRQLGVITIDGVAKAMGGERPGSCKDKTLDDLRAAGQAFDLPG